jgi:hypothetical protein
MFENAEPCSRRGGEGMLTPENVGRKMTNGGLKMESYLGCREILIGVLVIVVVGMLGAGAIGGTIYVDADANGANDGSSWADAYKWLQDALADANSSSDVNEIWLAEGIYRPDRSSAEPNGSGDREATFQLKDDMAIYGGFPSGGGQWEDRDPNAHETVLSGDLNGNDGDVAVEDLLTDPNRTDNSYHVVTGSGTDETAVLDGFSVNGGNADASYPYNYGGGVYNHRGKPTIMNCIFTDNSSKEHGGAIYNAFSSNIIVKHCSFYHNKSKFGAGVLNYYSSPRITNCTFAYNQAKGGAGMANSMRSSPKLTNCYFIENLAEDAGGAISNGYNSCKPKLVYCNFFGNEAKRGAAVFSYMGIPKFMNCKFIDNAARERGGGIYNYHHSDAVFNNCQFTGNSAGAEGGAMNNYRSCPSVNNSTFGGNWAHGRGGAIYNRGGSFSKTSIVKATNCIMWGNSANKGSQIYVAYLSWQRPTKMTVSYCNVQGNATQTYVEDGCILNWQNTNIDTEPHFVASGFWVDANDPNIIVEPNDPNAIWIDGDYHLLPGSPCIDAGDNTAVPADSTDLDGDGDTTEPIPLDLAGNQRFVDQPDVPDTGNGTAPIIDMGAFEANYIEVAMKFTPQALNPGSKGNWVKAHFVLPEGYTVDDVDVNTPAKLCPFGIKSAYMNVFINEDGLVEIEAAFDRADFCGAVTDNNPIDVTVVGLLTSGQRFYGTDTIRIINNNLKYLAVLTSYWLEAGCGRPDWCDGTDLDQNAVVDFVDFAMFDGCCIEVVGK